MITVGKKFDKRAVYIGRGSILGNPFVMKDEADRDRVCDEYERHFKYLAVNDPAVIEKLNKLLEIARHGDLVLG